MCLPYGFKNGLRANILFTIINVMMENKMPQENVFNTYTPHNLNKSIVTIFNIEYGNMCYMMSLAYTLFSLAQVRVNLKYILPISLKYLSNV
jgi:hypothetical protein